MADWPEDAPPTMFGPLPDVADGDATAAEARPPAGAEPEDEDDEDRTVQSLAPTEGGVALPGPAPAAAPAAPPRPAAGAPVAPLPVPAVAAPSAASVGSPASRATASAASAAPAAPAAFVAAPAAPTATAPLAVSAAPAPPTPEPPSSASVSTESTGTGPNPAPSTQPEPRPPADDAEDDAVTATAPRLAAPQIALSIPGAIQIRDIEDDELLDETEVRTLPGGFPDAASFGQRLPPPRPAAGAPMADDADAEDGPTTQAAAVVRVPPAASAALSSPRVGGARASSDAGPMTEKDDRVPLEPRAAAASQPEPPTKPGVKEPEMRPSVGEPPTAPGVRASIADTATDEGWDPEESITSRALAAEDVEDSITQQAPQVPPQLGASAARAAASASSPDDVTGGETTTKKRVPAVSPADAEPESITTQAPGPLTNILRVIAAEAAEEEGHATAPAIAAIDDDDEDLPQNQTAIMPNAPLKGDTAVPATPGTLQGLPPRAPSPLEGGRINTRLTNAVAAQRLEPSSDSGLRVACPPSGSGERASLGKLGVSGSDAPPPLPADALPPGHPAFAATEAAAFPRPTPPSLREVDFGNGPRYGLLVGAVAAFSIVVPIVLFFLLRGQSEELSPVPIAFEPNPVVRVDPIRTKGRRGAPPPAPPSSASASASASSAPSHR